MAALYNYGGGLITFDAAVGPPTLLTLFGDYIGQGGTIQLRIAGVNQFDRFQVNGNLNLLGGSILTVTLEGGFVPQAGQRFRILTFGSRSGQFTIENLPGGLTTDYQATFIEVFS